MASHSALRSWPLPLVLLAVACSDSSLHVIKDGEGIDGPQIEVTPERLNFGSVSSGETSVMSFTIKSVGTTPLEVFNVEIGAYGDSFTVLSSPLDFVLAPGDEREIEIMFDPVDAQAESQALVTSNDAEGDTAAVDLIGSSNIPSLKISPDPYDFGENYVGCLRNGELTLENVGVGALTISSVAHSGGAWTLDAPESLPLTLEAGEKSSVFLEFLPTDAGDFEGTLTVISDEPLGTRTATQLGAAEWVGEGEDHFVVEADPPADIMFLVDQSCSMDDNTAILNANFNTFINEISDYTTNWHIMVVNDDDGCARQDAKYGNVSVLTETTPNVADAFGDYTLGVNNGGFFGEPMNTEALLTTAALATSPGKMASCNTGFRRDEALLHIIFVTDEPEQSTKSWSTLTNEIVANIGAGKVKLSAIAGDMPSGCATADAGTGYADAVAATGGEFLSICATSWTAYMPLLASASVKVNQFELSSTAAPSTVRVWVNGTERTGGWTFETAENAVLFTTDIPESGDTIDVTYSMLVTCD
ncbi:choice-of-anchor D domain-containing protein [Myxococcota bacterium]|nr:choice-of-anchor D domain-containing protein [Myxococcota bacterium]